MLSIPHQRLYIWLAHSHTNAEFNLIRPAWEKKIKKQFVLNGCRSDKALYIIFKEKGILKGN